MNSPSVIAHFRITAKLGEGGMGAVYRATDTKLGRDVAIKVLPDHFANNRDRMARFSREAQVLASLNHPSIAAIYGVEERALILELVEGSTLADRIAQGPLPLDEALPLIHQLIDALEYAHERGVVHRDLKPSNLKLTDDGHLKVLDFGLAKALTGDTARVTDSGSSPTETMDSTMAGVVLGTAGYMSPEQARGQTVDKRADIWSFGVVFYEILTGHRAFRGETISETLAAVLHAEPDWNRLPADMPLGIRRLLQRCLERDPKRRLRDIGDARIELERPERSAERQEPSRRIGLWIAWASAALLAIAGGWGWWGWLHSPPPSQHTVTRSAITVPNYARTLALSRDGTRLAYFELSDAVHLSLRRMDQSGGQAIPGAGDAMHSPVFSPDGQWIAYITRDAYLTKIPASGGLPITLCEALGGPQASWGDDDTIVFGSSKGLMRVPAAGGAPQTLTVTDAKNGESGHDAPQFLPGGQTLLFTINSGSSRDAARIAVLDLKTGAYRVLIDAGYKGRYAPSGHLVYVRGTTLFAVPFDVKRLLVTGPETPVVERIYSADYTFSDSGLLVFMLDTGPGRVPSILEWTDRKGAAQPLPEPAHEWGTFAVSPDGKRAAGSIQDSTNIADVHSDIWTYALERGTLTRLTFEGRNEAPIWTPDGRWVTFGSTRDGKHGIYRVPVDGNSGPELLLAAESEVYPSSWTPDGKTLFYGQQDPEGGRMHKNQIWFLPPQGDPEGNKPRFFLATLFLKNQLRVSPLRVSPDGRWLAYESDESERYEVYVVPFPGLRGKVQISTRGGYSAKWSRSGRELYYVEPDSQRLMSVAVQSGAQLQAGRPQPLFKLTSDASWDVMPDGTRFLVERKPEKQETTTFGVITGWFEDLRRRVSEKH